MQSTATERNEEHEYPQKSMRLTRMTLNKLTVKVAAIEEHRKYKQKSV